MIRFRFRDCKTLQSEEKGKRKQEEGPQPPSSVLYQTKDVP